MKRSGEVVKHDLLRCCYCRCAPSRCVQGTARTKQKPTEDAEAEPKYQGLHAEQGKELRSSGNLELH